MFLKFFKRCFDSRDSFFDGRDDDVVTSRFLLPVFSGEHARQEEEDFFFFFFFSVVVVVEGGSILNDTKSDDAKEISLPQKMKRDKRT